MGRLLLALTVLTAATFGLRGGAADEHPAKGAAPAPLVRLKLGQRNGVAEGQRKGLAHDSAPLIDVTQPQPNVLVVTMTGLTMAGGLPCEDSASDISFELLQAVEVVARPGQRVKLTMEGQLAGLFRGSREGAGTASSSPAEACLTAGPTPVLNVAIPGESLTGKGLKMISVRTPACEAVVMPGEFGLGQRFAIHCAHPRKCFHKNVMMAAFGPETGRAPEWVALLDPTREVVKQRDFGFRVVLRADPAP